MAMNNNEICDYLNKLIQLDFDASRAYKQAIDEIDDPQVKATIRTFQADHDRHCSDLSYKVETLGGTPIELKRDIKGAFLEGLTAIRSATGTDGALKAMESNEKLTNKKYSQAMEQDFPFDVKDVIRRNYDDEQRHLAYIQEELLVRQKR